MKVFILIALFLINVSSSHASEAQEYFGYLVPDIKISMKLEKHDSTIQGTYSYSTQGKPISLKGNWKNNGVIMLTELDSAEKATAQFTSDAEQGRFPLLLQGEWRPENKKSKARNFRLYAVRKSGNVSLIPQIESGYKEAYVKYQLSGILSKEVENKLNEHLTKAISSPTESSEVNMDVSYFSSKLISYTVTNSEFTGAYSNNTETTSTISLETGNEVSWKELTQFDELAKIKWNEILKGQAKKNDLPELQDKDLIKDPIFSIYQEGIVIHALFADQGHAIRGEKLKVSWAELKTLLGKNALIKSYKEF